MKEKKKRKKNNPFFTLKSVDSRLCIYPKLL